MRSTAVPLFQTQVQTQGHPVSVGSHATNNLDRRLRTKLSTLFPRLAKNASNWIAAFMMMKKVSEWNETTRVKCIKVYLGVALESGEIVVGISNLPFSFSASIFDDDGPRWGGECDSGGCNTIILFVALEFFQPSAHVSRPLYSCGSFLPFLPSALLVSFWFSLSSAISVDASFLRNFRLWNFICLRRFLQNILVHDKAQMLYECANAILQVSFPWLCLLCPKFPLLNMLIWILATVFRWVFEVNGTNPRLCQWSQSLSTPLPLLV